MEIVLKSLSALTKKESIITAFGFKIWYDNIMIMVTRVVGRREFESYFEIRPQDI